MPRFTTTKGLSLDYRVVGAGAPTVLVHGWMVSGAVWDPIIDALVAAGRRLIIPDQRGTGRSDKPSQGYALAQYVEDLLELIALEQLDSFELIGHSMGGQIAQLAALSLGSRLASLSLVCPVPAGGTTLPDPLVALFRGCGQDRAAQTQILQMACKQLDEPARDQLLADAATVSKECVAQAFDAWIAGGFADRIGAITCPTLVIGTDDPFLPSSLLQAAVVEPIPNARFVQLPGPGHYPQWERPAETVALLLATD